MIIQNLTIKLSYLFGSDMFNSIRVIESNLVDAMFADIPDPDIDITHRSLEAIYFHNLKEAGDDESRGD